MNRKTKIPVIIFCVLLVFTSHAGFSFGFYAHRKINRMAVFCLPAEIINFFKKNIEYLSEHAIDPDKRARSVKGEDVKHYIDIDHYGENPFETVPKYWKDAVAKFTEDTLNKYGINPWWTNKMLFSLTQAFKDNDLDKILYLAANLGHYVADACTPLHTTKFYDGKLPSQKGIHAFWETRIPELFADNYNYLVGRAIYIEKPNDFIWTLVQESHEAVDTIFNIYNDMMANFPENKKYVYDEKGTVVKKLFSKEFALEFSKRTNNMVERRMRRAVHAVASLWYTAWVNAGQPDLSKLEDKEISKQHKKELKKTEKMWKTGKPVGRPNPE